MTGQYIEPDLFRSGQYLQSFLLQNENPLSLLEVPIRFVVVILSVAGWGSVGVLDVPTLVRRVVTLQKKSVIDFCIFPLVLAGISGSACGAGGSSWEGSAWVCHLVSVAPLLSPGGPVSFWVSGIHTSGVSDG